MNEKKRFWKPEPKTPGKDWGMRSLLVPILVSALGFFIVGVFAFSFDAINIIPANVRDWLTIAGSALVVFGAELNTPGTFVAVFRKWQKDKSANVFDWLAVILSGVGTCANLLLVFALLILSSDKFTGDASWLSAVMNFGPLVAAGAVACDYYGSLIELGFLFGAYELRYEKWLLEKRAFELQQEQKPFTGQDAKFTELRQEFTELAQSLETVKSDVQNRQMIIARYADFKAAIAKLNGGGEEFIKTAKAADVIELLAKRGRSTSLNTANKFLREERK